MDKIESLGESFSFRKSDKKRIRKKDLSRPPSFVSLFESLSEEEGINEDSTQYAHGETLEELLDQIHEVGDQLKGSANMLNIKRYRNAIKAFLEFVVNNMFRVEKRISGVNILKKKRLTLIKTVDRRLESLVAAILSGQAEQLEILSRVDEINGLIVDIIS